MPVTCPSLIAAGRRNLSKPDFQEVHREGDVSKTKNVNADQLLIADGQFRNWCRPNPDFLWSFVWPPNCMRLSAKKAAHRFSQLVPRCRKSGKR